MRGGGRTQSIFEILADMDESEYKRKLDGLMADTAGGKWQPPSLEDQENDAKRRRKKKKKKKKKGFSLSVAEKVEEAENRFPHGRAHGAKEERSKAVAVVEASMPSSKRKPRRRRGAQ